MANRPMAVTTAIWKASSSSEPGPTPDHEQDHGVEAGQHGDGVADAEDLQECSRACCARRDRRLDSGDRPATGISVVLMFRLRCPPGTSGRAAIPLLDHRFRPLPAVACPLQLCEPSWAIITRG